MKKKINRRDTIHSILKIALSGAAIAALFVVSLVTLPATEKGKAVTKAEAEKMVAAKQKGLGDEPVQLAEQAAAAAPADQNYQQPAPARYKATPVTRKFSRRPVPGTLGGVLNIPGDYPDLASAITDLNAQGVAAGGVTLNVVAGNPQTAPSGGYVVGGPGSLVLTTTSAANQVLIEGNGNTVTASAAQAAGSLTDAIFKLVGADYITIQDFFMQENAANTITTPATNNMTEWGVALLHVDPTDGAQNNTISSNTISLNRAYLNTFGVYSNNRHSATAPTVIEDVTNNTTAPQSGNRVYATAISNVNYGIVFIGSTPAANVDVGNDIGGGSAATGNMITNWGGGSAPSAYVSLTASNFCIFDNQQINDNVSFNTITSAALAQSVTAGGIFKNYSVASPTSGTITTTINNNTITVTNNPTAATTGGIVGIANQGLTPLLATATMSINNNTVQNCVLGGATSTTNGLTAIVNTSLPGTLNLNSNTVFNNAITATTATTGANIGLQNAGAAGTLNMNNNVVRSLASSATTTGQFQGVVNLGAVVTALNMNNNALGNASSGWCGYTAAGGNSGALFGVATQAGATTCAVTIQNNDVRGITHTAASTGSFQLIQNIATVASESVTGNTFTNLNINHTTGLGRLIDLNNSTAGAITVATNSIVGTFAKALAASNSGAFYCIYNFGSPASGTHNVNDNNFSNITTNSTSVSLYGIYWRTLSGPTANINNNTVSNWTNSGNTGSMICLYTSYNTNLNTFSNTVSNITNGGPLTGINFSNSSTTNGNCYSNTITGLSASGASSTVQGINVGDLSGGTTLNIYQNTISTLSGSGATAPLARGINVTAGTTVNVFKNKVCDIAETGTVAAAAAGTVTGMLFASGTTVNASNNLVGDLRAPASTGADVIRGIAVTSTATSTYNVYFNSVYLNATSSGATFGTSGVFHTNSTVATTAKLDLRDNIIDNVSTPGTTAGLTVAHRRSAATTFPANYATTSNNNLFYAGTPDATHLIYNDTVNSDQMMATYQPRVAPADSFSVTGDPGFISTSCGSLDTINSTFLHISNASPAYHVGAPITSITDDYDGDLRHPCTPDIGGDEVTSYGGPPIAAVTIMKTADSNMVTYGGQVGYLVKLTNTTANTAFGLAVTDNLPAAPGVNWTIDAGATDPGWSVVGTPPNQSLQYSPTTLAGNAMTQAHVVSATDVSTCGSTLSNTASFSITNGCAGTNSGMASASISVTGGGGLTTILSQGWESGLGSWIVTNATTGTVCPAAVAWAIQTNPYDPSGAGCAGSTGQTPINSMSGAKFCMANSDAAGSGVMADTTLTSPSFSTVGYTSLSLAFRHFYRNLLSTETAAVDISTDGGGTWTNLANYGPLGTQGTATSFAAVAINLNAYVGNGNVQVRFHYVAGWDWYWAVDDIVVSGNAPAQPCPTPAMVTNAVSRKTCGPDNFDIPLPLTCPSGVEDRVGPYTVVVTFDQAVSTSPTATVECQMPAGTTMATVMGTSGADVTISVTGAPDAQDIRIRVDGVNGFNGYEIPMGILIGDVNGNGSTNAADVAQDKACSGATLDQTNFRCDVNGNCSLNAGDVALTKAHSGTGISRCCTP